MGLFRQISKHSSEPVGRETLAQDPAGEVSIPRMVGELDEFFVDFAMRSKSTHCFHALEIVFESISEKRSGQRPQPAQWQVQRASKDMPREALHRNPMERCVALSVGSSGRLRISHTRHRNGLGCRVRNQMRPRTIFPSSEIIDWVQAGSQTRFTSAWLKPGTSKTFDFASSAMAGPMPHPGAVKVIAISAL
jgi:hypothetical protein